MACYWLPYIYEGNKMGNIFYIYFFFFFLPFYLLIKENYAEWVFWETHLINTGIVLWYL